MATLAGRVSLFAQKLCHLKAGAEMTENCHRLGIVFAVWDIDVFDILFCSACSTVRRLKKGKIYYHFSVFLFAFGEVKKILEWWQFLRWWLEKCRCIRCNPQKDFCASNST